MRILLVLDDYNELLYLQTLLKKLGFDVDGIQNERNFEESFLTLHPDLVMATAQGKRINGVALAEGIKKSRHTPGVVLLGPTLLVEKLKSKNLKNVDQIIESPVQVKTLLQTIARLGGLDGDLLLEKYRKIKSTLSPDHDLQLHLTGQEEGSESSVLHHQVHESSATPAMAFPAAVTAFSNEERRKRMKQALASLEKPKEQHFSRQLVEKYTKEIRLQEGWDELENLEWERQTFVKELFKKAKG